MVVVDSSVIVDILVADRPRHAQAKRLGDYLSQNGVVLRLPMHALLELQSAISSERADRIAKNRKLSLNDGIDEAHQLRIDPVPIDWDFLAKYSDPAIPPIRAGDYPFVAIAKCDGLSLITEDSDQFDAARAAGVKVFSIVDYLTSLGI